MFFSGMSRMVAMQLFLKPMLALLPIVMAFAIWSQTALAQTVYVSDSSSVTFNSTTPIELISAVNHASTAMIEMASKTVKVQVPVAAFQFENKMMQEHFTEGYLEPRKFPYATFRGKLSDSLDLSVDTLYIVEATGMLNVHGIDRVHSFTGLMICKDSVVELTTDFSLLLSDHEIKVPGPVFENIAKEVSIEVYFRLGPFKREE